MARKRTPYGAGPRASNLPSINLVKILFVLGFAAMIYAGYKFIPPYWNQFELSEDIATVMYPASRGASEADLRPQVYEVMSAKGIELVEPPVFDWGEEEVGVTIHYEVVVEHWAILKPTVLQMTPTVKVPAKPPNW